METGLYDLLNPCQQSGFIGYNRARCDMDTDNGGWLVIQRRVEGGIVDFTRGWNDYEEGFGDLEGEFWYGLKNIHCLTNSGRMELRMDMEDESGNRITWTYQEFRVEGPENYYRLHIGGEDGYNANGVVRMHNNMNFTTRDRDNDLTIGSNCASSFKGGWWYNQCAYTSPNGPHESTSSNPAYRISSQVTGSWVYYPNQEMKIRPKSCDLTQTRDTCA